MVGGWDVMCSIILIFFGLEDMIVVDFIEEELGEWKFDLIFEFFNDSDKELIFVILICSFKFGVL